MLLEFVDTQVSPLPVLIIFFSYTVTNILWYSGILTHSTKNDNQHSKLLQTFEMIS